MTEAPHGHYVALGSSFAAGPGIRPRESGSPRRAGRSSANAAHLVAARLGVPLTDVSCSGATAAQLVDGGPGMPAQVEAVSSATSLVTVTAGGNDVGYIGGLIMASLPRPLRAWAQWRARRTAVEPLENRFARLPATLDRLLGTITDRAPQATVVVVDYLTVLPPAGVPAPPLPDEVADQARKTADRLAAETAAAAERHGCLLVRASAVSADHHAWSAHPWTTGFSLGRRSAAPYHPNADGMRAIAELVVDAVQDTGSAD
ncbi:SGNH/GDSL hydrolase family protein [Nakamurella leprariae]|uniref:SGNH/GDSL hydrolase family protein n=1 Tax=Nakamurella leprariae TaxID=2803911 RepID=A0A938YD80_9ACTN|nr:SGNH/GDSL hydrolase family protein [Nakamurella leprariae]MBM9467458.1 SGNH/GDSL hydrolase family protein [Nakamurella leprariae]